MLKVLAILLPLAGLGIGLVYLRLMHGPISLRFLLTPMEQALKTELPGVVIDVEDAIVRLSERRAIEFRLKNIRVHENDGDILALAPLAALRLSTWALLSGRIAPSRIELIEPRFLIARDASGQLSLSFGRAAGEPSDAASEAVSGTGADHQKLSGSSPATPFRRLDLARTITEASARARRRVDAAAYLRSVGFKDAAVIYDADGRRSVWHVPEFDLRLKHQERRSVITGSGRVAGAAGEWTFSFRSQDSPKSRTVQLDASVQALVPRALAQSSPHLAVLGGIDLPISGEGSIELSADGEVLGGQFGLELQPGQLYLPWLDHAPHAIGAGRLDVRYAGDKQQFDIGPSTLSWGKSQAVVGGSIVHAWASDGQSSGWQFELRTLGGTIGSEDFDVPALNIDSWIAKGRIGPEPGRLRLDELKLQAGDADIAMTGDVTALSDRIEGRLQGQLGAMSMASLKALWPGPVARRTRTWIGPHLVGGTLKSGSFVMATSRDVAADGSRLPDPSVRRLSLTLEGADVEVRTLEGLPPLLAPRALLRVEGSDAELTIPEAAMMVPGGHRVAVRSGRLFVSDIDGERPLAEASIRAQAPLPAALDILNREPIALLRETGLTLQGVEGKAEGQVRVTLPLGDAASAADMRLEGKLRITDARARDVFAAHDIHGATIQVDATEKSIDVRGDMLLAGVNMKIGWQRLIGVADADQPPIKITARLDDSDRTQLGLDLNHLVHGEVPVEVNLQQAGRAETDVRVVADLTGAELVLNDISWRKPAGRPATLRFDAAKGQQHKTELRDFRLTGENIAIEGWVGLGADNQAKEYHFPGFSLNVVTNLDVKGVLRSGRVWDVKAHGNTYDGTELFRRLLAFGQLSAEPIPNAKDRPGLDLTAEIDTVLGASDTAIRAVKLKMQKRAERLTMLDLRGTLDGGKSLVARLRQEPGRPRVLVADTPDAGQALKLVGFYPNMVGGTGGLEVNLDGNGPAERFGVLSIRNFRVLGDPIVSEVLQTADEGRPAIEAGRSQNRRVVREQFDFERLHAPFSMGNGELVLDNAQVTGPVVGATMRGKIDYKSRRLQLGGTYVPLSGFNRSFAPIPLLGPLLTGPRGEGVLGITFAIQGPMAEPQVVVNPLSLVAPGFLREIFQMTPENPRITPREPRSRSSKAAGPQVRASPPTESGGWRTAPQADSEMLSGWSAETNSQPSSR